MLLSSSHNIFMLASEILHGLVHDEKETGVLGIQCYKRVGE
jgi:hypothetical protein